MNQIQQYINGAQEAISGNGGHTTTLRVARSLFNGFACDRNETLRWLHAYNARLSDKWSPRELEHKADEAERGTYDKTRGWMLGEQKPRDAKPTYVPMAENTPKGVKKGKTYVLATVATADSHCQRSKCANPVPNGTLNSNSITHKDLVVAVATVAYSVAENDATERGTIDNPLSNGAYIPTKEQRVCVPNGLSDKQRKQWLQSDLDAAFGG